MLEQTPGGASTTPQPLDCQVAFKGLSDRMLERKNNPRLSFAHFRVSSDPVEVLNRLQQSSLRDMLLQEGESFSMPGGNERYSVIGMVMGESPIRSVVLTHSDWQDEKWRVDPDGPNLPPFRIIYYPGEYDWGREIELSLWFGEKQEAAQKLSVYDGSRRAGEMFDITRSVFVPEYFETGYEGHNRKSRPFKTQEEAMFFISLVDELFKNSQPEALTISLSR